MPDNVNACGSSPDGEHHRPTVCTCDLSALEPDEDCPQHGHGEWPPRCAYCGRFIPWKETYDPPWDRDYPPTPGTGEELLVSHEEWLAPLKGALNALAASAPALEAEEETR